MFTSLVIALKELRKRGRGKDPAAFRIVDIPSDNTAELRKKGRGEDQVGFRIVDIPNDNTEAGIKEEEDPDGFKTVDIPSDNTAGIKELRKRGGFSWF